MLSFLPGYGAFALAGLIAAAGPLIIHLLNRRRFRVLDWAAMEFLLEAVRRSRRVLQLRDLLLLLLRTACVLLFGLALARPYFSTSSSDFDPDSPVHAVMVVDNSLSMNYEQLGGTLLDQAKTKAEAFIDSLPEGSYVSVIPACGTPAGYTTSPYRTREDARDALQNIEVVDRGSNAIQSSDLALEASEKEIQLAKRVVFIGDQQQVNWQVRSAGEQLKKLPELQVAEIRAGEAENSWISDLTIQDAVADMETDTLLIATVRHSGREPRNDVQVTLSVDGVDVASRTIDLEPGQMRRVSFKHRFDVVPEPGQATFVPVQVSMPPDRLPGDDRRYLVVPVVAALPVVFIDQHGPDEQPDKGIYGETHNLRRLLAPVTERAAATRQLVKVRHGRVDQLNREMLQDSRLVVIAGAASPGDAVPLLRQYVQQGGQLLLAAGAEFDPDAWQTAAWLDGEGILPAPLKPETWGQLPEQATGKLETAGLVVGSMQHQFFVLPDVEPTELASLYEAAVFFKAVRATVDDELVESLQQEDQQRIAERLEWIRQSDADRARWAQLEAEGKLTGADREARLADERERATYDPNWLLWAQREQDDAIDSAEETSGSDSGGGVLSLEERAEKMAVAARPTVLARLDNGLPYLIERKVDRGRVVLSTSGLLSQWNTLPVTNAMLIYDRILRGMLKSTFPRREYATLDRVAVPIGVADRRARFELTRPDGTREELFAEAVGSDRYGVLIRDAAQRGIYTVTAYRADASAEDDQTQSALWEAPLAINGPAEESDLAAISRETLVERLGDTPVRWVGPDEDISLQGASVRGEDLWWWLILLVMVTLLVEMLILAWPTLRREATA